MSRTYRVYTYACEHHDVGEFVRLVSDEERDAIRGLVSAGVSHALGCWVRGCQHSLVQVRLCDTTR